MRSVLRRDLVQVINGLLAPAARHIYGDESGISGDVPAEKFRSQSAVDVVAAARAVTDDHPNGLAAIKISDFVGLNDARAHKHRKNCRGRQSDLEPKAHACLSVPQLC